MIQVERKYDKETGKLIYAVGKCHCGTVLDIFNDRDCYDTIECPRCGRLYNSSGDELRPRDQWEEPLEEEG